MHISYKNRLLWQIKVTHPLAAIFYNRFTYPWRFTRVPSVINIVLPIMLVVIKTEMFVVHYILLHVKLTVRKPLYMQKRKVNAVFIWLHDKTLCYIYLKLKVKKRENWYSIVSLLMHTHQLIKWLSSLLLEVRGSNPCLFTSISVISCLQNPIWQRL